MDQLTKHITRNAKKINQLKERLDETSKLRDQDEHKRKEWEAACENFHSQFDSLAFPGGLNGAFDRILDGDPYAVEAALCFLECRPYFFRSGYLFKDILRKTKKAPLKDDQRQRLDKVLKAYDDYKASRKSGAQ